MKKTLLLCVSASLLLVSCTPVIILSNPDTGKSVTCGGFVGKHFGYGVAGYKAKKVENGLCVKKYQREGYNFQAIQ